MIFRCDFCGLDVPGDRFLCAGCAARVCAPCSERHCPECVARAREAWAGTV